MRAGWARLGSALLLALALATRDAWALEPGTPRGPGLACAARTARMWAARDGARRSDPWPRPLDRLVAFDLGDMPLGRALESIAGNSGIRVSYSPDVVPVARGVCLSTDARPLGEILVTLLNGTGVSPVVVGSDQVVLAPVRSAVGIAATPEMARSTGELERVVVTGTVTGAPARATPFAIGTVEPSRTAAASNVSLASLLDAAIPGLWMWNESPVTALARYGSIRGASSFGVSTPKIYIDGIEVANPLLLTTIDPEQVERIEVIRGPQGAALYGADAISGVVNIQMRHDGAEPGAPTTSARLSAGTSASAYADGGVLAQEYGTTMRTGSAARAASLAMSLSTLGAFTPGASARQFLASASTRHVGARLIVTGTGRFEGTNADAPVSPILREYLTSPAGGVDSTQRVRQYTLGGTATFQASEQWTHALTLGVDGYRLSGVSRDPTPLPSLSDSALRAARGGADRLTLRYNATRRYGDDEHLGSMLSVGLEHSTARERSSGLGTDLAPRPDGQGAADSADVRRGSLGASMSSALATSWWNNTGLFTQGQLAVAHALFVTGGARVERIDGPSESGRLAWLPMLGVSLVQDEGPLTVKLRSAYGRGIRPARTVARGATFTGGHGSQTLTSLEPEEQAGIEAGLDVLWNRLLGLHVTRFDQRASGLVQPVAILGITSAGDPGSPEHARVLYQLQNVGAIDNKGWELAGTSTLGALTLSGTLSIVSSHVATLASGYLGDLHEGDRLLEVPARTMGLQATWTMSRWSLVGSLARAADWVNYDEVALAQTIAADPTGRLAPVGDALRAYWRTYDGSTRVGFGATYRVQDRTSLTLTGANLLNRQLGEPDNITVVPGRSIIAGLRTTF